MVGVLALRQLLKCFLNKTRKSFIVEVSRFVFCRTLLNAIDGNAIEFDLNDKRKHDDIIKNWRYMKFCELQVQLQAHTW